MVPESYGYTRPSNSSHGQRFNSDTNPNAVVWGPVDLNKGTFTGYIEKVKVES